MKTTKCGHRRIWIIGTTSVIPGNKMAWCYGCGAFGEETFKGWRWWKPVGPTGENPALSRRYLIAHGVSS